MGQCVQQGYTPKLVLSAETWAPGWNSVSAFDGATMVLNNANFTDTSIPAVKEYNQALQEYAPNTISNPLHAEKDFSTWLGGQLFAAAAKAGNLGPQSAPAQVISAMYLLHGETVGGLTAPLTYQKGQVTTFNCYFTEQMKNGQMVSLNGGKPTCVPGTAVQAYLKAIS
jgi:branched-chain amino acid transport system substrate-binding protein